MTSWPQTTTSLTRICRNPPPMHCVCTLYTSCVLIQARRFHNGPHTAGTATVRATSNDAQNGCASLPPTIWWCCPPDPRNRLFAGSVRRSLLLVRFLFLVGLRSRRCASTFHSFLLFFWEELHLQHGSLVNTSPLPRTVQTPSSILGTR